MQNNNETIIDKPINFINNLRNGLEKDKDGNWKCNHNFNISKTVLKDMGIDDDSSRKFLLYLKNHGCKCDCGIIHMTSIFHVSG